MAATGGLALCISGLLFSFNTVSQEKPAAVAVHVDAVVRSTTSQAVATIGRLVARQQGYVANRIAGTILEVHVEVGDAVNTGDIIALLDAEPLQIQVELAQGKLARSDAELATSRARLKLARQERDRLKKLQTTATTSKASYEDAMQNVLISEAKIEESRAAVQAQTTALKLAQLNLTYARIKAPFSGVITNRLVEIGTYVRTGDNLMKLVSAKSLEIESEVPSKYIDGLTPGDQLSAKLGSYNFKIIIRSIIPEENHLSRTRAVRFIPQWPDDIRQLAVNQSVSVAIPVGKSRQVISVHKDAVLKIRGSDTVYIVENDVAIPRQVVLGEAIGSRFEVKEGLKEGDLVVIRGNERLRPNTAVIMANKKT